MSGSHVFVLLIIALTFGYGLIKAWIRNRSEAPPAADEHADEMIAKMDALEERIRVLERIVTDHDIDLKKEIDRL